MRALGTATLATLATLAGLLLLASPPGAQTTGPKVTVGHGLAMHGDLKYPAGFKHFQYVNPEARKGGDVKMASVGSFDTLNPFVVRGVPAAGTLGVFDTLTIASEDEPFSQYGLIAETIEVPADRSGVAFTLRAQARFHDGSPITVEDVIWTFETLKAKGLPFYRSYYAQVTKAEKVGERKVRFSFDPGDNRELPLIVGQLPVLSRTYWSQRDFEKTTLEPPLGNGAYKVEAVDPGRSITYRRVKDYWAARLPVNVGRENFDSIRYDYYRDITVAVEALKGGEYDFRAENVAKNWATAYNTPAVTQGLIKKEEIPNEVPTGMQAFVYNTRRPIFQDARVRRALAYAFDFEWANRNLFFSAYTRTKSYFSNSELASSGPPTADELKVLEPFRGKVADEVFTREYQPPVTDGSGNIRDGAREALKLLADAGWTVKGQKLVNERGESMQFEILLNDPTWERIALPFAKNLERLGIAARVRTVDAAQAQKREDEFDFDVTVDVWRQSLSPGNEQRDFWGSESAGLRGSRNTAGIKDPVVDRLIDLVIAAPDRPALVARTRALDRVLLWGHYVIPHWHLRTYRVVYWDKFARPAVSPKYALGFDTWWVDPQKEAALARRKGELPK
jgi:microcin C transport system substrate-binding protein